MNLSAPIYALKNQAKKIKQDQDVTLSAALDLVARREGFKTWSLLKSHSSKLLPDRYSRVLGFLNGGDLVLVAARPGMGKTSFCTSLFAQGIQQTRAKGFYFNLSERRQDTLRRLSTFDDSLGERTDRFSIDCSEDICAEYVISVLKNQVEPAALIVIDYLQLLDEVRTNPPIQAQIEQLKAFAKQAKCIFIFICQIQRAVSDRENAKPDLADIRLPNPLDLGLFNKIFLLNRVTNDSNQVEVCLTGQQDHHFNLNLATGRCSDL